MKEFVESTNGKLKLFFLPGYSPELNPDETVWSYVKHHVVVKEALYSLMHKPRTISAFFSETVFTIYMR
ncbi:MAG: hypothetical protein Ta2B_09980 [Termitinemataceae bacterium]|nr:MAG: hypothetical protein Ta2B_09980 [Termitinemataceae bacterium]